MRLKTIQLKRQRQRSIIFTTDRTWQVNAMVPSPPPSLARPLVTWSLGLNLKEQHEINDRVEAEAGAFRRLPACCVLFNSVYLAPSGPQATSRSLSSLDSWLSTLSKLHSPHSPHSSQLSTHSSPARCFLNFVWLLLKFNDRLTCCCWLCV